MTPPFESSRGHIFAINAKLCWACCLCFGGYFIWPEQLVGYGWGFLALIMFAAAIGLVINAVMLMIKLHNFKRPQEEFLAGGNEVKSSSLASKDFLTEKGVIRK